MMTTNGNGMLGMIDLNPLSVCSSSTSCSPAHTRSLHTSLSHVNTYISEYIMCERGGKRRRSITFYLIAEDIILWHSLYIN